MDHRKSVQKTPLKFYREIQNTPLKFYREIRLLWPLQERMEKLFGNSESIGGSLSPDHLLEKSKYVENQRK